MKRKLLLLITAVFFALTSLSAAVSADVGPKDSVAVSFKNLDAVECYCTLLSEHSASGPYSVSGEKSNEKIPRAFQDYRDSDGFYYLEFYSIVSSSKSFSWGYMPPTKFKVLLYFPKTEKYAVSDIIEKKAFNAGYTVDMKDIDISAENQHLEVVDKNTPVRVAFSFLMRVVLTVLIELAIAVPFFKFRSKKPLLTILIVNIITQILLNLLLNTIYINIGAAIMILSYIPLEIAVFIIESIAYSVALKPSEGYNIRGSSCVLYSFLANLTSFIVGAVIGFILPWF